MEDLGYLELIKDILKDLIVLDHLVLILGIKVHLVHRYDPRVRSVHQLAVHGPGTGLETPRSPPIPEPNYVIKTRTAIDPCEQQRLVDNIPPRPWRD